MRNLHFNYKRISLWILLLLQILLIILYLFIQADTSNDKPNLKYKVSFLKMTDEQRPRRNTYHTTNDKVLLDTLNTRDFYIDFNTSLCYRDGTDLKEMQRSKNINWKCECLPGWHGTDCGQPEVIWRALLSYRKPVIVRGPRKYQRKLLYILNVDAFSETIIDIRVHELNDTVDLFILSDDASTNFLERKLNNNFLKDYHNKILYLKDITIRKQWTLVKDIIGNLYDDDIVLTSESNGIPNKLALKFLKLYDKWPQPIGFRMRWSVYGFFWLHPSKTILTGGSGTILYLQEILNDDLMFLRSNKMFSNPVGKGIIVGDLNHFGGWFCQYCFDSAQILEFLNTKPSDNPIVWGNLKYSIDKSYVEDLIENGIYLDGKTELLRTHRSSENYYAPAYVSENSWKYDWLLVNLYSKIDYY